ncbi:MAG TPA: hypothetical protein VKB58_01440 [Terriglobales bacterium]|jgi:hypothetical protein|nr:hypothetical protein [Terriglobales bacterium]
MSRPDPSLRTTSVAALLFVAVIVVAPFALRGVACGHDLTFHMDSWMEVAQQWRQGVFYPRWAPNANYGSGEPRFLFYPPLSWMLGGALGSVIPWIFAPVAFDMCAVFLAGFAMLKMAREWFEEPDATLIAIAYAINPYMLLTIYARSAVAEELASAFFPLLVLWTVRERPARQMFLPLALTMAGIWLSDVPAAIIATYLALLLIVTVTVLRRNSRVFLWGAGAIGMGFLLAAFYIVPVLYERSWINLGQVLSTGVRPAENFLFARTGGVEHDSFIRALSWLAVGQIGITAVAILAERKWRPISARLWWSLAVSFLVALVLTLPMSGFLYRLTPDLRFVQFPWRWLLVTGLAYAVFVVVAMPAFASKASLYLPLFVGLIVLCNLKLQPQCGPDGTPFMISKVFYTGYGYMGMDEYVPATGDNYEIKPDFPEYRVRGENGGAAPNGAHVTTWKTSTYHKQLTVESPQAAEVVLRLMNYPAWQVEVNGLRVTAEPDHPTGRMVIALPAGRSEVDVRFVRTPDRWVGNALSTLAFIFLLQFWYGERKREFSRKKQLVISN